MHWTTHGKMPVMPVTNPVSASFGFCQAFWFSLILLLGGSAAGRRNSSNTIVNNETHAIAVRSI